MPQIIRTLPGTNVPLITVPFGVALHKQILEASEKIYLDSPRLRTKWDIETVQVRQLGESVLSGEGNFSEAGEPERIVFAQIDYILFRGLTPVAVYTEQAKFSFTGKIAKDLKQQIAGPKTITLEPFFSLEVSKAEDLSFGLRLKSNALSGGKILNYIELQYIHNFGIEIIVPYSQSRSRPGYAR